MLSIENIIKTYRGPGEQVQAIRGVTLSVDAGEFVAVRGPSGCGKSTLLLAAGGLLEPEQGHVVVAGEDLYALGSDDRARCRANHIGFVFQQFHLVPYLSVRENVLTASMAAGTTNSGRRTDELLERFGLTARARHVPSALSTGERQRTALARALLNQPRLLLADEPTGNLDAENAAIVLGDMRTFADEGGAVLLVTHDTKIERYADRSIEIEDGCLQAPSA